MKVPKGHPTETWTQTSTNAAQNLTAANIISGTARPIGALITVVTNDIIFTLGGSTPVSQGLGHMVDIDVDNVIELTSGAQVKNFQFISQTAGSHGVLMITVMFEPGKGD